MTRYQRVQEVRKRIEDGALLTDFFFDALLPKKARDLSERHWTPTEIAIRAARLLAEKPTDHILDVGSGAGKFCVLGGLSTPGKFTGVEIRKPFFEIAEGLAEEFDLEKRVRFLNQDLLTIDWKPFTGFYLFNPFYEHIAEPVRMEPAIDFGMQRFEQLVRGVQAHLREAPIGTKIAIFHGFGGGIPVGYRRLLKEAAGPDFLELWERRP